MEDKGELVKLWLNKSQHDLIAAEALLKSCPALTDIICFHCQQSAEKNIKAYLVFLEIDFQKTHDLDYLLGLIEHRNDFDSILYDLIDMLENFALEMRYPNQKFEPTLEEANLALTAALKIESILLSKINSND